MAKQPSKAQIKRKLELSSNTNEVSSKLKYQLDKEKQQNDTLFKELQQQKTRIDECRIKNF